MKKLYAVAILVALWATDICVAQSRGVKLEKEECEVMALRAGTNPRASGSGASSSEAVALNIAKLQARNELAAQVAAEITGIVQHRVEQYTQTAGAGVASVSLQKDSMAIVQRVSQILTNTRPICQNTYSQSNGSVMVYVCIEMGLQEQRKLYGDLKEEGIIEVDVNGDGSNDIDFNEKEFLLELAKAREEYNAKKAREE